MPKHDKQIDPQHPTPKPPLVDELAQLKQKAEEKEVAGRHKNDGQSDHQGNRRQPGTPSGKH